MAPIVVNGVETGKYWANLYANSTEHMPVCLENKVLVAVDRDQPALERKSDRCRSIGPPVKCGCAELRMCGCLNG